MDEMHAKWRLVVIQGIKKILNLVISLSEVVAAHTISIKCTM